MTTTATPFHRIRASGVRGAQLVAQLASRIDALSTDLARDLGAVERNARRLATSLRDSAITVQLATPRIAQLARLAAGAVARARWLRLRNIYSGDPSGALTADDHRALASWVARELAGLRGGLAKLAQLASCRPDLVGPVWASELAKLQDDATPVPPEAIRAVIERELGGACVGWSFDDTPLAVASLAQVHAATLADGTRVVVKVQVPGIIDAVVGDLAALRAFAAALPPQWTRGLDLPTIVDELERAVRGELDYVAEAAAMGRFADQGALVVARPLTELSTAQVLTMTRIDGVRLTEWLDNASPAARAHILGTLIDDIAAQVLERGELHADPHPGNFLVITDPEPRLALLDFGCTLTIPRGERAAYRKLCLAIITNDREAVANELANLGFSATDPAQLVAVAESMIGALRPDQRADHFDWEGAFAAQLARARELGAVTIPRSFVLLGRVLAVVGGLLARYRPPISLSALLAPRFATTMAP